MRHRLVLHKANPSQENVLMQIRGEGLADEQGHGLAGGAKIVYVLHPNCAIDEIEMK